jgi:hypothetical protein
MSFSDTLANPSFHECTTQQNFKDTLRNSRGFAAWLGKIGSCLFMQRVTSW